MLTRKPRIGDLVRWPDWAVGRVARVSSLDANLCWISERGRASEPFIWSFRDGLNKLAEIVEILNA